MPAGTGNEREVGQASAGAQGANVCPMASGRRIGHGAFQGVHAAEPAAELSAEIGIAADEFAVAPTAQVTDGGGGVRVVAVPEGGTQAFVPGESGREAQGLPGGGRGVFRAHAHGGVVEHHGAARRHVVEAQQIAEGAAHLSRGSRRRTRINAHAEAAFVPAHADAAFAEQKEAAPLSGETGAAPGTRFPAGRKTMRLPERFVRHVELLSLCWLTPRPGLSVFPAAAARTPERALTLLPDERPGVCHVSFAQDTLFRPARSARRRLPPCGRFSSRP